MEFEVVKYGNDTVYQTFLDSTRSCGVLRFTHELLVGVTYENGKCQLHNGWEINCGGSWSWEKGEDKEFEESHPLLLSELAKEIKKQMEEGVL